MTKRGSGKSASFVKIGFSTNEALVYQTLLRDGASDVKHLAQKIGVLPNALYRLLIKLQDKGLINLSGRHPAFYHALPPAFALDNYLKIKKGELETAKEMLVSQLIPIQNSDQTRIDLIKNNQEFFLTYAELANKAKKEIDIISIGEPVPEEVLLANRDAIKRGVVIRFIVHKSDENNKELLSSWIKMGLLVKHYPDWGFHLVIFDKGKSLLSINNPERTSDRIALVIYSEGLTKAHADYFESVWKKAKKI